MLSNIAFLMWKWHEMAINDWIWRWIGGSSGCPDVKQIHPFTKPLWERTPAESAPRVPRAETLERWHPNVHRPCHEWWLAMPYQIPGESEWIWMVRRNCCWTYFIVIVWQCLEIFLGDLHQVQGCHCSLHEAQEFRVLVLHFSFQSGPWKSLNVLWVNRGM